MAFNTPAQATHSYQSTTAILSDQASIRTYEIDRSFACGHYKTVERIASTPNNTEYQFIKGSCRDPICNYSDSSDKPEHTKPTLGDLAQIPVYSQQLQDLRTKVRANFQLFDPLEIPPSEMVDFLENGWMAKQLIRKDRPAAVEKFFRFREILLMIEKMVRFGSRARHRPYFDFCQQRAKFLLRKAKNTLAELEESFLTIRAEYTDEWKYDPETFFFDHTLGVEELKTLDAGGEEGAEMLSQTFSLENWHKTEVYPVSKKLEKTDPPKITNLEDAGDLKPLKEWAQRSRKVLRSR
jgi:hypothetical protein